MSPSVTLVGVSGDAPGVNDADIGVNDDVDDPDDAADDAGGFVICFNLLSNACKMACSSLNL